MIRDFEYKGRWWLLEKTDKKIEGTLSFVHGEDITLELSGVFEQDDPEIIMGISDDNKITLYKNLLIKRQDGIHSVFIVEYVFLGKHFNQPQDIGFSSVSINYTYLEEWLSGLPFKYGLQKIKLDCLNSTLSINHSSPAFIVITPEQHKHFRWYEETWKDLENFLTLVIGYPVYPKILKGYGDDIQIADGGTIKEEIEIFYSLTQPNIKKYLYRSDMIIPFPSMKDKFEEYINNWFAKSEKLRPIYDLFFGTIYDPSMYREFHFLALSQAIESFHRCVYGGQYVTDKEYELIKDVLIKAIPDDLDEDFKKSLKKGLEHGNEFSLMKRLKELVNQFWKNCLENFVRKKSTFIDDIYNTRNYLTHYDERLKNKAVLGEDLFHLNERLKLFLTVLLLDQLGITRNDICEIINNRERYNSILLLL